MAKPAGARCNLACDYCFYQKKGELYPNSVLLMNDNVMKEYIRQTIQSQEVPHVTIAWQGGEPTLMGLDFFRRAIEFEKPYSKAGVTIENTIQTNGILLDEEWAEFLRENNFLVGLSLDGPKELHDAYRHDKTGHSVFNKVFTAVRLMQKSGVEFNVLTTVNAMNHRWPLDVYRFFRDELGARYLQFIPIVEPRGNARLGGIPTVSERSVDGGAYGKFLIAVFNEWVRRDVGKMFVQIFDGVLASYLMGQSTLCIFQPTCGQGLALEHNGDLYSCDHFVENYHLLGNIMETPLKKLAVSKQQRRFGNIKHEFLPNDCLKCHYKFTCFGGCPKNRIAVTPSGEPGLNWLCAGLKDFFNHTERTMRLMAELIRQGRDAADIMALES